MRHKADSSLQHLAVAYYCWPSCHMATSAVPQTLRWQVCKQHLPALYLLGVNTTLHVQGPAAAAYSGESLEGPALCCVNSLPISSVALEHSPLISQGFRCRLCYCAASVKLHCLTAGFVWTSVS